MDTNGRSLEQIYGPLSEGSDLTLLCLSKGGKFHSVSSIVSVWSAPDFQLSCLCISIGVQHEANWMNQSAQLALAMQMLIQIAGQ